MGVKFSTRNLGELRTEITHTPSGTVIETDAPTDNRGKGSRFSPTDLASASLASCMLTTMEIVMQKDGVDLHLTGARAAVEKIMSTEGPRRIERIVVALDMPPGVDPAHRPRLERIAHTCPVALSLNPNIQLDVTFNWA
ncbi:MAG TPA: OsmC family protein [Gemmatimonadaceae bacterium]|nr:OsmC family protein [Gemmatimonadaceae bacterium]